jgi:flagellar basal body-associated protein FliL
MPVGSQAASSTGGSRKIILFVVIAVVIVLAAGLSFYFSGEIKSKGRLLTQKKIYVGFLDVER